MVSSFAGIETASVGGSSSRNFEPGLYTLRLDGLKVVDAKKAPGTRFAIVECNVRDFSPGVVTIPYPLLRSRLSISERETR